MTWDDFDEICMRFDNCNVCPYYNATNDKCELSLQIVENDEGDFDEFQ